MNIENIKNRVRRVIKKAPLNITLMRPIYEPDGRHGKKVIETIEYCELEGIFDNTQHSVLTFLSTDGGIFTSRVGNKVTFIVAYRDDVLPQLEDYFILNNRDKYTVGNVVNILELNIVWMIDLDLSHIGGK